VALRVGRVIALLFYDRGTRSGWVVSSTPRPHFTPGKYPVPILQEAGWASGSVWKGGRNRNENQEYFLRDKVGRCVGLTILSPSSVDCREIWKPQPPGTHRAYPGPYRDCYTSVATGSKAEVCGRSPDEIVGSNPTGGMDVCLLWILRLVRLRSCDEPIIHLDECYRLWCIVECDLKTSWMMKPWTTEGLLRQKKKWIN